ncbi:hypothetical protein, partial [Streptomyces sp. NPDC053431]|uniref:hypothetical protein n=1 Tax=Streptomyces sp. NPDC053431 TaxID=3365703 RepID=UPI0037D0CCBE
RLWKVIPLRKIAAITGTLTAAAALISMSAGSASAHYGGTIIPVGEPVCSTQVTTPGHGVSDCTSYYRISVYADSVAEGKPMVSLWASDTVADLYENANGVTGKEILGMNCTSKVISSNINNDPYWNYSVTYNYKFVCSVWW